MKELTDLLVVITLLMCAVGLTLAMVVLIKLMKQK